MKIYENPFYILGVSPVEDRYQLMERADEARLSGSTSVEDAVSSLLQMNKRIVAEIGWFPGVNPATVASFTDYIKTISEGGRVPFPSVDGLKSPIAQANALSILFELWPGSLPLYTIGLCRSLDMVLSKITVKGTLAWINEDRIRGGWDSIPDETMIVGPLEDRICELCRPAESRMERLGKEERAKMLDMLLSYPDFNRNGRLCRTVLGSYAMRIYDEEKSLREQLLYDLKSYFVSKDSLNSPSTMNADIERWCKLTAPLRKTEGPAYQNAGIIGGIYRQCITTYFNNAPTITKTKSKEVRQLIGTKTITLTYQSKENAAKDAERLTSWLITQFPEQTGLIESLRKDQKIYSSVVTDEEMLVSVGLANAK